MQLLMLLNGNRDNLYTHLHSNDFSIITVQIGDLNKILKKHYGKNAISQL